MDIYNGTYIEEVSVEQGYAEELMQKNDDVGALEVVRCRDLIAIVATRSMTSAFCRMRGSLSKVARLSEPRRRLLGNSKYAWNNTIENITKALVVARQFSLRR